MPLIQEHLESYNICVLATALFTQVSMQPSNTEACRLTCVQHPEKARKECHALRQNLYQAVVYLDLCNTPSHADKRSTQDFVALLLCSQFLAHLLLGGIMKLLLMHQHLFHSITICVSMTCASEPEPQILVACAE